MKYASNNIRNILIAGHAGSGKTTLTEALVYFSGAAERMGRVEDGTTISDFDPEEAKRKASLSASVVPVEYEGIKYNLIDAPGLFDFEAGEYEGIRAAESVLVCVSGRSGVTVGAEKAFQLARKNGKATMVFVSKCDLENANYFKILEDMKIKFGATVCPCVVPAKLDDGTPVYINLFSQKAFKYEGGKQVQVDLPDIGHRFQGLIEAMSEAIAETDDELMEKFFGGEAFTTEEIVEGMRKGVKDGLITPVFCGSAVNQQALDMLLYNMHKLLPSPEHNAVLAEDAAGEPVEVQHPFQRGNVGGNIQRIGGKQLVQPVFKGGDEQIHAPLNALLCLSDVGALHILCRKLGVGVQQLEGSGQIVVHKFLQLRLFAGVLLCQLKDAGADRFQTADLGGHHRVRNGVVGLPQLLQKGGVLVRWCRCGLRFRLFGRLGRSTAHHKGSGAVVDVGVGTKVTVGNGTFHRSTPLCGIDACGGKQLVQRDVVAVACDLVQQAFQLAGAVHAQAGQQSSAAAQHLGDGGKCLHHAVSTIHEQGAEACEQKDGTADGAQGGKELVPLLGILLLFGGNIVAVSWLGFLPGCRLRRGGAEVGTIVCLRLCSGFFFFFSVFIDAF